MENFCGSPFWDSNITWNTRNPNFTSCFENTILVWIPCAFLWLIAPIEIYNVFKSRSSNIFWNIYNITKVFINFCLIVISGIELAFAVYKESWQKLPLIDFFSPVIQILTFSLALLILKHNKNYGRRASGLLFTYWLLLFICSIPRLKTEIEEFQSGQYELFKFITCILYFSLIFIIFILNCFADKPPLISSNSEQERPCPEYECSFLSRLLYYWFDQLVQIGYQRPLKCDDLWSLDAENTSEEITKIFDRHWEECLKKTENCSTFNYVPIEQPNVKKQASILKALYKTFATSLLHGAVLQLAQTAVVFLPPYFLNKLISFITSGEEQWKGYLYTISLFVSVGIRSILSAKYLQVMSLIGMRTRTALISVLYKKSLRLSNDAKKDFTIGEIVNLMSVDVQKFYNMTLYINHIWAAPLQICVAIYLLWNFLGQSVFSGLAVIIILLPLNAFLVNRWEKIQSKQMKSKDQRLKLMNEILNGIKVLKLNAWELSFETEITNIRNDEMKALKKIVFLNSGFAFTWLIVPFFVSLIIFMTFVLSSPNNILDSKTAFVSLSLLSILQSPLLMLPYIVNQMIQTFVSTKRVNKFMNSDELDPSNVSVTLSDENSVKIEDGTFSWGMDNITLKDIDINIKHGCLVAVVGSVGSGKSSMLSAILGEMNKVSGEVSVSGSIAYVSQQAWIQNETLKNNILFGKTIDDDFYDTVVDACALKPDLEMLPGGDQTEIGEKGINLSGGQKQRVSLARAVYFDSDIYLLDDPLSAVDSHVGKHIFEHVIGSQGLLNQKTRILITNAINYLPKVDLIIVLKDGTISESGTYQELLDNRGLFSDFLIQYLSSSDQEDPELLEIKKHLQTKLGDDEFIKKQLKIRSISENESIISSEHVKKCNETDEIIEKNDNNIVFNNRLIEEEGIEVGNIKWPVYLYYFKILGPYLLMATLLSNTAYQAFSISRNIWLSKWATYNDFGTNSTNNTSVRDLYLGVYGALGLLEAIVSYIYNLAPQLGFWLAAKILHENMLKGMLRSPLSFFDTTPSGRILSRFSKDVDVLDESLPWQISESIFCLFDILGTLVVISMSTPLFTTVIIPIGFIYYFIQRYFIATSRQIKRLESVTRSPIYSHFQETLTGVSTVRAYKLQNRFIVESEDKVDYNHKCSFANIIAKSWITLRLQIIGSIIILFSALFAVIIRDKINPAIVGLSVSYALQITTNLNWLVNMVSDIETNIVAVERIKEYSENVPEKPWVISHTDPKNEWPQNGELIIKDIVMKYRSTMEPVLHSISCHIGSGEKIGIVGRTGAGKSSLTLALFRIMEVESGQIFIDDIDISTIGLHKLRSRLTIIPQDPVLFTGTLRFNLDPFNAFTDDEIWSSLEHAHLKTFTENLSGKLEYIIDEGGVNLSVGQRQLMCLARALLRKSRLLILDEATAAVDLQTDDLIQQTIKSEFTSCTILTIAHRINTVMDSDRVLVLDKGKLVEFDTPTALLNDQESVFYKLAKDSNIVK